MTKYKDIYLYIPSLVCSPLPRGQGFLVVSLSAPKGSEIYLNDTIFLYQLGVHALN